MVLLAGAVHAGHGYAEDLDAAGAATVGALDLEGATSPSDEARAGLDWCALAPGCALGALEPPPTEAEPRLDVAVLPADARLLTGRFALPNPHPPRPPQA